MQATAAGGLVMLVMLACAHAIPEEDRASVLSDLTYLVQERTKNAPPEVAEYDTEQFASLMNRIVQQAGKMRIVMNKLGISDTDSVQKVEEHFIKLGESHDDLGEGTTSREQLRLHGLQARACVKHAVSCSHMAASCHATPKHCKPVVEHCSRAAAACGVGESKKVDNGPANPEPKHWEKTKKEQGFLPNPPPTGYFKKKKEPTKSKSKPSSPQIQAKPNHAISLIEEEAGEDNDFAIDDDSESLDEQLTQAQAEAEEEVGL